MLAQLDELWRAPGVLAAVLEDLRLSPRQQGRAWQVRCPSCGQGEAFCYPPTDRGPPVVQCNRRNACGFARPVFALLEDAAGGRLAAFARLTTLASGAGVTVCPAPAPNRPPADELEALWRACSPVDADEAVAAWLRSRGLDPCRVADSGCARALPPDAATPPWARYRGRAWTETTHRVLVPMRGPDGRLASVHARALNPLDPRDKAASPAGHQVAGLVMADALGTLMLAGAPLADGHPAAELVRRVGVVVAEGVPDWLTWATRWSDANEGAPAVLGVIAGSWTAELAARVPDGARVSVRMHADAAGAAYADKIVNTLTARCDVRRET